MSDAITLTTGGVVADSNGFFHPQGDHGETTYVVDGQTISDQQSKAFSTQLPPNAFQSMELVRARQSAEFGDKTGLVVNAVTRSGLGQTPSASLDHIMDRLGPLAKMLRSALAAEFGQLSGRRFQPYGRILDSPEFTPFHDIGNTENLFDRIDYQPSGIIRSTWTCLARVTGFRFRTLTSELNQDQRQEATTLSFGLGYQHTLTPTCY